MNDEFEKKNSSFIIYHSSLNKKPSRNRKIGEGTTVFGTPFIKPHFVNLLSLGLGFKIEVTTIKVILTFYKKYLNSLTIVYHLLIQI